MPTNKTRCLAPPMVLCGIKASSSLSRVVRLCSCIFGLLLFSFYFFLAPSNQLALSCLLSFIPHIYFDSHTFGHPPRAEREATVYWLPGTPTSSSSSPSSSTLPSARNFGVMTRHSTLLIHAAARATPAPASCINRLPLPDTSTMAPSHFRCYAEESRDLIVSNTYHYEHPAVALLPMPPSKLKVQ